jgi:hypothetical protein
MSIKRCNYIAIAILVVAVVGLLYTVFGKQTIQLEDEAGNVQTGEIKTHLFPKSNKSAEAA